MELRGLNDEINRMIFAKVLVFKVEFKHVL